jgi:hypothetical protein
VTGVTIKAIPHAEATMPNPCAGVPVNPWCPNGSPITAAANAPLVPAAVAGATLLPNTALGGGAPGAALGAGLALSLMVAAGSRRRFRRTRLSR